MFKIVKKERLNPTVSRVNLLFSAHLRTASASR